MSDSKYISIKGAKVNNLKNIDVDIPRNKLVFLYIIYIKFTVMFFPELISKSYIILIVTNKF